MNVAHLTRLSARIVAHVGVDVRYEFDGNVFKWNFYRDGVCVKSISKPSALIDAAERLTTLNNLPIIHDQFNKRSQC